MNEGSKQLQLTNNMPPILDSVQNKDNSEGKHIDRYRQ